MASRESPEPPRSESVVSRPAVSPARDVGLETAAVHGAGGPEPRTGAVLPPVFQTTTYRLDRVGADADYSYSRVSNPTVSALESALASFEGAPHALAFATGMAAISTLALAELSSGDHVVCSQVVYGGTARLCDRLLAKFGVETTYVDSSSPERVAEALRPNTRWVILESPANPTLRLSDLAAIARATGDHPARIAVDNTFLTAALQRPLELGADLVIYSTTKHIEGHNATLGGALVTADSELAERLAFFRKTLGTIQAPWEAWLTLRGLKTLPLRLKEHSRAAFTVARYLESHPAVTRVYYPGLENDPQFDLARRQQRAGGGLVAFEVVGGTERAVALLDALELWTLAENLGAVESLVTHPATMTHADMDPDDRRRRGIGDGLIRLSVGLERTEDLIADLEAAFAATASLEPGS